MTDETRQCRDKLTAILLEMGDIVVGFSGGVDSALLTTVAYEVLGSHALAVIGDSEAFPQGEADGAVQYARDLGIELVLTTTHELNNPLFRINTSDRCFHCKTELYQRLRDVADERGFRWIADGAHMDDMGDHRPGMRAAENLGVRSPLLEAGFSKAAIRELSQFLGLPQWDKPAFACLSSRFPYGTEITAELLNRVDRCEKVLRELGFRQFRVRHHDTLCRIEVPVEDIERVLEHREIIQSRFREFGYLYVALDLEGYRSGKMNDGLPGRGVGIPLKLASSRG